MQEWSSKKQAFDRYLAVHCKRLVSNMRDRLITDIRCAAQGEATWFPYIGYATAKNFWDEWAWAIATDSSTTEYDDNVRQICQQTIERLPLIEREILERTTSEYYDFWEVAVEPTSMEARRWLIGELVAELWTEADDRGQELVNAEEGEDES